MRVKARVVKERGRTQQPGGDEHVAGGLRPPAGRGTPHELALARPEPAARLDTLALQVALSVHDGLRLPCGAARERDQAGVAVAQVGGLRRSGMEHVLVRHVQQQRRWARELPAGCLQLGAVALIRDDHRRPGDVDAQAQVLRAQLLGARQHDGADVEAREHAQHPLRPVAYQRHDDVAAPDTELLQVAGERRGAVSDLAERPLAPRAVPRQLDERQALCGRRGQHIGGEVQPLSRGDVARPCLSRRGRLPARATVADTSGAGILWGIPREQTIPDLERHPLWP